MFHMQGGDHTVDWTLEKVGEMREAFVSNNTWHLWQGRQEVETCLAGPGWTGLVWLGNVKLTTVSCFYRQGGEICEVPGVSRTCENERNRWDPFTFCETSGNDGDMHMVRNW